MANCFPCNVTGTKKMFYFFLFFCWEVAIVGRPEVEIVNRGLEVAIISPVHRDSVCVHQSTS